MNSHALHFLLLLFPALISAACDACTAYSKALSTCQKSASGTTNVTAVGDVMDTSTINCMCRDSSSAAQINTCNGCWNSDPLGYSFDITVLLAWNYACKADDKYGEEQAVLCWEGQPLNSLPCFQKGGAGGLSPTALGTR